MEINEAYENLRKIQEAFRVIGDSISVGDEYEKTIQNRLDYRINPGTQEKN